jgi:hypothetical protein
MAAERFCRGTPAWYIVYTIEGSAWRWELARRHPPFTWRKWAKWRPPLHLAEIWQSEGGPKFGTKQTLQMKKFQQKLKKNG